jgi:hypothetical protein
MGYVPPLDIVLEGEALKSWLRLKTVRKTDVWDGVGKNKLRGHRFALQKLLDGYEIPEVIQDPMPRQPKWTRCFQVLPITERGTPIQSSVVAYTTGARKGASAGAGFSVAVHNHLITQKSLPLGAAPTAHLAAVFAIMEAATALLPYATDGPIIIHTSSQAALRALENPIINSKTVLATSVMLDALALASSTKVALAWASPHSKSQGLASAKLASSLATAMTPSEPEPVIPVPASYSKSRIDAALTHRWNVRWTTPDGTVRTSRALWPKIDLDRSKLLLRSDRHDYGTLVRMLTGHNYLNKHKQLLGETASAKCRLCNGESESSEHILCDCPALGRERLGTTGRLTLPLPALEQVPLDSVWRLILLIRHQLVLRGLQENV